jgi:hypothetical protein
MVVEYPGIAVTGVQLIVKKWLGPGASVGYPCDFWVGNFKLIASFSLVAFRDIFSAMEALLLTPKHAMPSQYRQRRITPSPEKIIPTNTTFIFPKKYSSILPINAAIPKSLVLNMNEAKIGKLST